MTEGQALEGQLDAAWNAFEAALGIPSISISVCRVMFIRADPLDGAWITCMAEVSLGDQLSYGFATASQVDDRLRIRAISEAVERAVWETGVANPPASKFRAPAVGIADPGRRGFLPAEFTSPVARHATGVRAEPITSGSAVHDSPLKAMSAGVAEVKERIAGIGGFHRRSLGQPVTMPPEVSGIADAQAYGWHDQRTGLVSVAVAGPATIPRLAMASSLAGTERSEIEALEHSYSEIVQSRAWIRRLAHQMSAPRLAATVVDPATRAEYWCSSPFEKAEQIIRALNSPAHGESVPMPDPSQLYLTSAAKVILDDGPPIWYARIVAPDYPYALHSFAVERRLFYEPSTQDEYVPHPYI